MQRTEVPSELHPHLDRYEVHELVDALIGDQGHAIAAVQAASAQIAAAVAAAVPRLRSGGRLLYAGAGSSGRLGALDSVELYPTFSWPPARALAILAGGPAAMFVAAEGQEDNEEQGAADLKAVAPTPQDVALLIAASGTTPYVLGALAAARAAGALTIAIANNPGAPLLAGAEIAILLDTGSELISGSTRLKAGTAQKIALNTLSSAIMVRLDKVYGNLMVDLHASNAKLYRRAIHLTVCATGADEATARRTLEACNYQVKVAIVAILKKVDVIQAETLLRVANGNVGVAIEDLNQRGA